MFEEITENMFVGFSWRDLQWSFSKGWEFRSACGRPQGIEKIRSSPEIQIQSISIQTVNPGVLFIDRGSLCEMVSHAEQREIIVDWVSARLLLQGRLVGFSYIWNMCLSRKKWDVSHLFLGQDFNGQLWPNSSTFKKSSFPVNKPWIRWKNLEPHPGLASLVYQTGLDWRQRWHNGRWPRRMWICGEEPMSCGKVVSILVAKNDLT